MQEGPCTVHGAVPHHRRERGSSGEGRGLRLQELQALGRQGRPFHRVRHLPSLRTREHLPRSL